MSFGWVALDANWSNDCRCAVRPAACLPACLPAVCLPSLPALPACLLPCTIFIICTVGFLPYTSNVRATCGVDMIDFFIHKNQVELIKSKVNYFKKPTGTLRIYKYTWTSVKKAIKAEIVVYKPVFYSSVK